MPPPGYEYPTFEVQGRKFSEALAKAIRHAERVCKREHIKADRVERVNQFVVSVRRELLRLEQQGVPESAVKELVKIMTQKSLWYDIGHLHSGFGYTGSITYSYTLLEQVMRQARLDTHSLDAQRSDAESDIEDLQAILRGVGSVIEDARRINQDSEQVVAGLEKVFA